MTVYSFWLYNRHGKCIFHREYDYATMHEGMPKGTTNTMNESHNSKLIYGMLYSLRNISSQITNPIDNSTLSLPLNLSNNNPVLKLQTAQYKLFTYTTLSGVKGVVFTDLQHPDDFKLDTIVQKFYTQFVSSNPWFDNSKDMGLISGLKVETFLDNLLITKNVMNG